MEPKTGTDEIEVTEELQSAFLKGLVLLENGCWYHERCGYLNVLKKNGQRAVVSIQRVAWAIFRPDTPVSSFKKLKAVCQYTEARQLAILLGCPDRASNRRACVNPDHLQEKEA